MGSAFGHRSMSAAGASKCPSRVEKHGTWPAQVRFGNVAVGSPPKLLKAMIVALAVPAVSVGYLAAKGVPAWVCGRSSPVGATGAPASSTAPLAASRRLT